MLRLTIDEAASYGLTIDNAKSWARPFSARILQAGLVSYKDKNRGVSLLRHETIARHAQTFVGRPVVVNPIDNSGARFAHEALTPENMKALGHGYVTEVFFNSSDGWWWVKGVVDTEQAQKAIEKVGLCSCSYEGSTENRRGAHNDIPFDNEITEFTGKHLAVVHNPRYGNPTERALIFLNSKSPMKLNPLKLFWNKPAAPAADPTKTAAEITAGKIIDNGLAALSGETKITIVDNAGKDEVVTVEQLAEVWNARGAIDPEAEVEVAEGKRVALKTLVESHNALAKVTEQRDNAFAEVEKAKKAAPAGGAAAAEKVVTNNAKAPDHFRLVTSAATRRPAVSAGRPDFGSLDEGVALGLEEFGSKPAKA